MKQVRGMFRIYTCESCNHTDYISVESEDSPSKCGLCGSTISDNDTAHYVETVNEAEELVHELVLTTPQKRTTSNRSVRGVGMKKRVLYIVDAIVDTNRGRPASKRAILEECELADIPQERVIHFLKRLEEEGLVIKTSEGMIINVEGGL